MERSMLRVKASSDLSPGSRLGGATRAGAGVTPRPGELADGTLSSEVPGTRATRLCDRAILRKFLSRVPPSGLDGR